MDQQIRAVVFDLDGTLADTADLVTGPRRRTPADVLALCPPGTPPPIDFGDDLALLPGSLIAAGYRVGIVTRSPMAYASTVIGLLHLDWQALETSEDPRATLPRMATQLQVPISQILYVGDRTQDESAALGCGTQYLRAPWIDGGTDEALWYHPNLGVGYLANQPKPRWTLDHSYLGKHEGLPVWVSAMATLMDYPGYRDRRRFQLAFLRDVPRAARRCVMPQDGRIFWPEIVTHAERVSDPAIDDAAIGAVGRLFPAMPVRSVAPCPARACVPYTGGGEWGQILQRAKDWTHHHSGAEVRTNLLELPATAIAAALRAEPDAAPVVPVAPSPYNTERPGQASLRVAYRAADLSNREVLDVLMKQDQAQRCVMAGGGQNVVVIDDQITQGENLTAAVESLTAAGYRVKEGVAWSMSGQGVRDQGDCALAEWRSQSYGTHAVRCQVHGL